MELYELKIFNDIFAIAFLFSENFTASPRRRRRSKLSYIHKFLKTEANLNSDSWFFTWWKGMVQYNTIPYHTLPCMSLRLRDHFLAERLSHAQPRKCMGSLSLLVLNIETIQLAHRGYTRRDFMAFEEEIDKL